MYSHNRIDRFLHHEMRSYFSTAWGLVHLIRLELDNGTINVERTRQYVDLLNEKMEAFDASTRLIVDFWEAHKHDFHASEDKLFTDNETYAQEMKLLIDNEIQHMDGLIAFWSNPVSEARKQIPAGAEAEKRRLETRKQFLVTLKENVVFASV